jgi:hypothetical protein
VLIQDVQKAAVLIQDVQKVAMLIQGVQKVPVVIQVFQKSMCLYRSFKKSLCSCYYDCGYALKQTQAKMAEYCDAEPAIGNTDNVQVVRKTLVSYCVRVAFRSLHNTVACYL